MLMKIIYSFFTVIILIIIVSVIWQINANKIEEPKYKVLSESGDIEIRQYSPMIIAQVKVSDERYKAIKQGFRELADYIYRQNHKETKIQMMAPVMQEKTIISMKAPVAQQSEKDNWVVSFVMPQSYNMNTLPKPNNPNVILMEVPKRKYIVIQFSGFNSKNNIEDHKEKLNQYIKKNKITIIGEPVLAFYNPPWTWPFLRRNEIMYELS